MAHSHPLSDWQLHCARRTVFSGGVIAYPTEAVWGLGCDPWDQEAVERILELKQRPVEKGMILVASSVDQIRFLLDPLTRSMQAEAERPRHEGYTHVKEAPRVARVASVKFGYRPHR